MKTKILSKLKTKYSNLGFGEKAFDGVADYLSKTVTEESQIEAAIAGVEPLLKAFQGDVDKIRTEKSELQKQYDELKAKQDKGGDPEKKEEPKGGDPEKKEEPKPDDMKAMIAAAVAEAVKPFQEKIQSYEKDKADTDRNTFISSEAKRLGIDESDLKYLNVPAELDNAGITSHLTAYKQHMVDKGIPERGGFPQNKGEITQEQAKEIADSLLI